MSLRIGGSSDESGPPKSAAQHVGEGVGCLFACLGLTLILWAVAGFPGLAR